MRLAPPRPLPLLAPRRKNQFNPSFQAASLSAGGCRSRSTVSMNRRAEATLTGQPRSLHACRYQAMTRRTPPAGLAATAPGPAPRPNRETKPAFPVCLCSSSIACPKTKPVGPWPAGSQAQFAAGHQSPIQTVAPPKCIVDSPSPAVKLAIMKCSGQSYVFGHHTLSQYNCSVSSS
jgi:hypothetical protein